MLASISLPPQPFSTREAKAPIKASKPQKKSTKIPPFSLNSPPISTQSSNLCSVRCMVETPDGCDSSECSSVQRLVNPEKVCALLKSSSSSKEVKRMHALVVRLLDKPATFVYNNLMSSYLRFLELEHAEKLFDIMPERNVVTWTALLDGYLNMGLDDEALILFRVMIDNFVEGNSLTFVCSLKLCGNVFALELGRQLHASVVKRKWSNLILDSAIVYLYAQCGDLSSASRAFEAMPVRDVVCWTTMIMGHARHGCGNEAFSMFSQMMQQGFRPNEYTVCNVLKACGEEKDLSFGKKLHGAVIKGMCRGDVYVGSSLISMYVRCGEISGARAVFDSMATRNMITWTSMLSGYAQHGLGEEALLLFKTMKRRRISANNLTIVSLLSACGSVGCLNHGKSVHAQILRTNLHKNIFIESTLIWFYCTQGDYIYATRVLHAMPARDVVSWTAVISGFAKLEHGTEALGYLKKMLHDGVEPNPFTYSSALKACASREALEQGRWIHASASKTMAVSNVFVGSSLINMYLKCGLIEDAFKVFDSMPERNLVSWKTMVVGYAKNGQCSEALKLMYRMQAEGFCVDDFVLSTVLTACGDVGECDLQYSSASCSYA